MGASSREHSLHVTNESPLKGIFSPHRQSAAAFVKRISQAVEALDQTAEGADADSAHESADAATRQAKRQAKLAGAVATGTLRGIFSACDEHCGQWEPTVGNILCV
jgi:hypothetical protein